MATVKTRILIISDTHAAPLTEDGFSRAFRAPFRLPVPQADVLIHCGDLTKTGTMEEYHKTFDMLSLIDAPMKLVIAGNHDLSLDREWVINHRHADMGRRQPKDISLAEAERRHIDARDLWTAIDGRARQEGITFLDEGVHQVQLKNGADLNVYASPYTPAFYDWGFAYEHDDDRWNEQDDSLPDAKNVAVNPIPSRAVKALDIVLTHGPAYKQLDLTARGPQVGCPHLLKALSRARPKIHCFGHIHEAWGANRITWNERTDECFRKGNWEDGMHTEEFVTLATMDKKAASDDHSVHIDLSSSSATSLKAGEETFIINAAIMDLSCRPSNAPWLVDLDLEKRS